MKKKDRDILGGKGNGKNEWVENRHAHAPRTESSMVDLNRDGPLTALQLSKGFVVRACTPKFPCALAGQ